MLVNNAGFGAMGDFGRLELARQLDMIDLNVKSLVELTHRFLAPMREQRLGTIINVASTAGFQAVPFMATYAATKAFVLSFSEALAEENRPHDIDQPPMRTVQTPEEVVDAALRGLPRKKSVVVSGWTNWLMVEAERFVPRGLVSRVAGKALRSRFD